MNELFVAIVGGTISTVVGGLILAAIKSMSNTNYSIPYSFNAEGCLATLLKLAVIGLVNTVAISFFWGMMRPGLLDFGISGVDFLIKVFFMLIINIGVYAKLFFNIDLMKFY